MQQIDLFAVSLLEEAKRFLEKAQGVPAGSDGERAYLHAALLIGIASLEAHISAIGSDFAISDMITIYEKGLLQEKEVRLINGEFVMTNSLKMWRLEDRIEFIHKRFSAVGLDRNSPWWADLKNAIKARNDLIHPKEVRELSQADVSRALQAIVETLNVVFLAVYQQKFPGTGRGVQSQMSF